MRTFMTPEELAELTGYVRCADQRKWLKKQGWAFEVSRGGRPIVARSYFDARMNRKAVAATSPTHHFDRLHAA
ncbi:hypothetical protein PEP31012_03669 [Pandoraea eparura]|uniref:DUF4224 domain-containing protein n=1 Tax=Pandoraea eparura TaxID=2508291 RepID=A0A5E4X3P0_9BURK|nr:hypothetical protein PEP31012_03669 [Pandoraea eparura]